MSQRRLLIAIPALLVALAGGTLAFSGAAVVGAGIDTNSGTVKIFDGDKELPANDPKVCGAFEVRGLGFDADEQDIAVDIVGQGGPNAGTGSFSGSFDADANGDFSTGPISLSPGMYKLDSEDGEGGGDKNKVFKVECEPTPTPPTTTGVTPGGTETPGIDVGSNQAPTAPASSPRPVVARPNLTG